MSQNWSERPRWNGPFNWFNFLFLVSMPVITVAALIPYVYYNGVAWFDVGIFAFMWLVCSMSITAGYHRLFAHRAYLASPFLRAFYLFFGAGAIENSALSWCSDHRIHHRFVDTDSDPYNIKKGFFWAHMGWIFYQAPADRNFDNAKDLARDPLVRWQHRNYTWLCFVVSFGIPTAIGWTFGRPFAGFLWGGLLRLVLMQHSTFLVNSAAHYFGKQPYSKNNTARDCWWLGPLTFGEGYHNFHHAFAGDFRNGVRWFDLDPSKWWVTSLSWVGQASNLQRTPEKLILKAKLEARCEAVGELIEGQTPSREMARIYRERLAQLHTRLESVINDWAEAKKKYLNWKKTLRRKSLKEQRREVRAWFKDYRSRCRREFKEAMEELARLAQQVKQPILA